MLTLRDASLTDLDFLIEVDLIDEGITPTDTFNKIKENRIEHRNKIMKFLTDSDKGAYIYEDLKTKTQIGTIMYSISNRILNILGKLYLRN